MTARKLMTACPQRNFVSPGYWPPRKDRDQRTYNLARPQIEDVADPLVHLPERLTLPSVHLFEQVCSNS